MPASNDAALDLFVGHVARATRLAQALTSHFEAHFDCPPDEVHYGHVGSAAEAVRQLEELCRFLEVGPEHSPS